MYRANSMGVLLCAAVASICVLSGGHVPYFVSACAFTGSRLHVEYFSYVCILGLSLYICVALQGHVLYDNFAFMAIFKTMSEIFLMSCDSLRYTAKHFDPGVA